MRQNHNNKRYFPNLGRGTIFIVLALWIVLFPFEVRGAPQTHGSPIFPTELTTPQIEEGWISLFDQKTLFGWKPASDAKWNVENGEIRIDSGEPGLLRTTSQFDDFELVVEFKADLGSNSGIFFRTSPTPKNVIRDCYELNIAPPENPFPTGSLVGRKKCESPVTPNQWHRFHVIADGPKIEIRIDDENALEYVDPNPIGRGYIGLQLNQGGVSFRRIALKPLNTRSLMDGQTLDQWDTSKKLNSDFKITKQNELRILNGKGQLESKELFGDFIFSMQCKTNAVGLNSGVFFRCIPSEVMNGYESQIQNLFEDNDPTKPVDCGTGGIFRRTNARRVNALDQTWFTKTIIATGPHVSVWVNGYQVTDWSDTRKPDPNPRRGLRLEKGTIIFQGHDPTTDILLKNIRAKEIAPRRTAR
ncbi:MAG: 3-keto-disaccharide hydrolase [Pirellulales bacterium]|jgi:hypothetical protein